MQLTKILRKRTLIKITYGLILLLFTSAISIIAISESPERMIQGTWQEKEWYIERGNTQQNPIFKESELRNEILRNIDPLHYQTWDFRKDRFINFTSKTNSDSLEWIIKGRGHILELRRAGIPVETFQIQQISEDLLELHLNFDLQVKGVMKIVLERVKNTSKYATKI